MSNNNSQLGCIIALLFIIALPVLIPIGCASAVVGTGVALVAASSSSPSSTPKASASSAALLVSSTPTPTPTPELMPTFTEGLVTHIQAGKKPNALDKKVLKLEAQFSFSNLPGGEAATSDFEKTKKAAKETGIKLTREILDAIGKDALAHRTLDEDRKAYSDDWTNTEEVVDAMTVHRSSGETEVVNAGSAPTASAWTGVPGSWRTEEAVKQLLNDPDSYKLIQAVACTPTKYRGQPCWRVKILFRAKNAFGGYVQSVAYVYETSGEPVTVLGAELER
jgi:hypothetical protein